MEATLNKLLVVLFSVSFIALFARKKNSTKGIITRCQFNPFTRALLLDLVAGNQNFVYFPLTAQK
jgi:hypothetical protein